MTEKQITLENQIDPSFFLDAVRAQALGFAILLVIRLDGFDIRHRDTREASIINKLKGGSELSTAIIEFLTDGIYREIYPEWIYRELSLDDLVSLALNSNNNDFLLQLLKLVSTSPEGSITFNNDNLKNLIDCLEPKNPVGAKTTDYVMKTLNILKAAIIAGVLSAGKKIIEGVTGTEDVLTHTVAILNASIDRDMVKKMVFEKAYTKGVGVAVRQNIQNAMKPVFNNYGENGLLPLPTAMECFTVSFLALWSKDSLWTGKVTRHEIPLLGTVYQGTFTVPEDA